MTRPARLARMQAHAEALEFVFVAEDAPVPVAVELQPRTAHALRHLHALHAHADGCQGAPPMQRHVDLLLRALRSVGGEPTCVLVRPGPCPAFWLEVTGAHGTKELDLDVLDAACLLMSRKVAVKLLPMPPADWDQALRRLIGGLEGPPPTP